MSIRRTACGRYVRASSLALIVAQCVQVILELGDPDAIDAGRTLFGDHPLASEHQVTALTHDFHQPATLLRFRPNKVHRFRLGTPYSPLRVPARILPTAPPVTRGLLPSLTSSRIARLLALFHIRPFAHTGSYHGLG